MREPLVSAAETADIRVVDEGTVVAIYALNSAAKEWMEANVQIDDWQRLGDDGFGCEPRSAESILQHAVDEGMVVECN